MEEDSSLVFNGNTGNSGRVVVVLKINHRLRKTMENIDHQIMNSELPSILSRTTECSAKWLSTFCVVKEREE